MAERHHVTTQNRFYPDMSNVNKNITVEAKLISPPTYIDFYNVTQRDGLHTAYFGKSFLPQSWRQAAVFADLLRNMLLYQTRYCVM